VLRNPGHGDHDHDRAPAGRTDGEVTSAEVERFLRSLDREGLASRNVKPPETFTVEEVLAIAIAAREGHHRLGRKVSAEEIEEERRLDLQDSALYIVAGFTGLRQGELVALKWGQVRFEDRTLVIIAGMSAGTETTTKSGKWRAVPLNPAALRRRYWRARDAASVPKLPFHHLRHSFATLAICGLDPAKLPLPLPGDGRA
jgi:integrase